MALLRIGITSTRVPGTYRKFLLLAFSVLTFGILQPSPASADESLRDRIRQRVEERRASLPPADKGALTSGTHEYSLVHQGLPRTYLVHVPKSYSANRPVPLVFAFHGGGGDAWYMADDQRYGLISKSEQAGFVVVFPNGYSRLPGGKLATWNAGNCCGDARDREIDDVGFVRAVLAQISTRINVDRGRVFATGMSNGAMLTHRLACEMADVFSAVAAVAGTDGTRQCSPARPISVLHIHAKNDDHVLFDGGAGAEAFRDHSKVTEFGSVPATMANWTSRNRCDANPVRTLARPGAYCESYGGCAGGVHVQLCVTETGGHSWPGAAKVRRGKELASQALSASDLMWEFFATSARPPAGRTSVEGSSP